MFILFIVALTLNAYASSNHTDSVMREALKYFESIGNNNSDDASQLVIPKPTVPSSDILNFVHTLIPDLLPRPVDSNINEEDKLSIESREKVNEMINPELDNPKKLAALFRRILDSSQSEPETRRSDTRKSENNRRMIDWFSGIFSHTTTPTADFKSIERGFFNGTTKLSVLLSRLNELLERLNENILALNSKANKTTSFYIIKMPVQSSVYDNLTNSRRKRESQNVNGENEYVLDKHNTTECKNNTENDRIGIHRRGDEKNDIKNKLVEHLKGSFDDIRKKIASVVEIKELYSDDNAYRIGYVLANIDILDINLGKLLQDLDENRFVWDEKKLLDLFDKLKESERAVSKLSDFVATYANKQVNLYQV